MQKLPQIVIAVVVAAIALVVLQGFFASDETRIRWQIEAGAEAFNRQHTRHVVERLAENYRDVNLGVKREDVRLHLAGLFLRELDPQSGEFNFEVEVELDGLKITDHEENTYRTVFAGVLRSRNGKVKDWDFEVSLWWREVEGDWLVFRSQFTTSSGRRPF